MNTERGGEPNGAAPFGRLRAPIVIALTAVAGLAWLAWRFTRVEVSGNSMWPFLRHGDFLVVDQQAYRRYSPLPGDVIVIRDPRRPERELVKRVQCVDTAIGIWVEGDNPAESMDSRHFGWARRDAVVGRVIARYGPGWPVLIRSSAKRSKTSASVGNASGGGSAGSA